MPVWLAPGGLYKSEECRGITYSITLTWICRDLIMSMIKLITVVNKYNAVYGH